MSLRKVLSMFLVAGVVALGTISCKSKISDADLKAKVETAVSASPGVMVDVKDGVVTLTGTVGSEDERMALENSAKAADAKGVKSVVNNITVQAPIEINTNDADLTAKIVDATKDFPTVKATVAGGVITVTGTLEQARVMVLKQSLDALNPKKVDMSALVVK
ncbi:MULTISPECIES: BON domain-containing protein [Sphingobacterium]|uniref:BON domain-containing protein n=1 Tax=Sphingobacterium TaxID=28453 RepID=UPI0013DB6191|nr:MULTISPECIES: BON domain-containing protein [unclassified Sphingobacterium]